MPAQPTRSGRLLLAALLLLGTTALVYLPVLGHGFVPLDDPMHVTANPHVRTGLSTANVRWAFTNTELGYWVPLTWLSHQLDAQLFGLDAGAHHGTNLLLHLVNTLLLLLLLQRTTRRLLPSSVVAGLFALHPLHVESVAWVSERKDVLSTLLLLITLHAYVAYTRRPGARRYGLVLLLFALALMAKPMVVTLPLLLLLLDAWPLERLADAPARRRALVEKLPLLGMAAAVAVVTWRATRAVGAMAEAAPQGVAERLQGAVLAWLAYLGKALWPADLAVVYPHPDRPLSWPLLLVLGGVLAVATLLVLRAARRRPYLASGWLWYLVALLPVIGLVRVGPAWIADRYTYVPLVGLYVLVTWGVADLAARRRHGGRAALATACVVLLACAVGSARHVRHWQSGERLFAHGIAATEDNWFLLMMQGTHLHEDLGRTADALPLLESAATLRPDLADIQVNLGNVLRRLGREDEALTHYRRAVEVEPGSALAHYNLGVALMANDDLPGAIRHYRRATALDPRHARAHCNLGCALLDAGRPERAAEALERALQLDPADAIARRALERVRAAGAGGTR